MPTKVPTVKVTVTLSEKQVEFIRSIAFLKSSTMTEVIRHSISLEAFIQEELGKGSKLLLEDYKGNIKQLVIVEL